MKFGCMSLDFKRFPLEHCFRLAGAYGMDGLEIFCARKHIHLPSFTAKDAEVIRGYKKRYGVEVPMLTPNTLGQDLNICSADPAERKEVLALLKQGVDAAEMIEAPRLLITADHPGYFRDNREIWALLVESVGELAAYAEKKNVRIVMEPVTPMESPVVTTARDCLRLFQDVNSPALYAMLDVVPPIVVHEPFSQYFELLGERMDYIHICNTDGVTDAHLRLEQGVLPVADAINTFLHHGYQGYVTAELYTECFRDPELMLSNTVRALGRIRTELGV